MVFSHLLRLKPLKPNLTSKILSRMPKAFCSFSHSDPNPPPKPSSLSARMSFLFEQIDAVEKQRAEKDQSLQRIRAWRDSRQQTPNPPEPEPVPDQSQSESATGLQVEEVSSSGSLAHKKEVELVHPWPEWIELMERLVQQNYFDHSRKDENGMLEGLGFNLSEVTEEEEFDFVRDFKTVQTAIVNFGRDRFDILRSLSRQDLQILVGYGCPTAEKKVVFSAKLLRKQVHLDEGDVCSSCSLRGSCEKAYLLTNKEDEARTIDVMRVLLTYGFDPINGSVVNKSLLKMKLVKTVVRKLLHEVVRLSAVPIDPNLPPPVIKKPPPKVKQPPPPPKKRVGRDDIEMKKGDWLCPKCDFMNFAKNTVCLQCDAKRPKRELLPGEWECPQCNFLNYRRNMVCFHCETKRPPDTFMENQLPERQHGPKMMDKITRRGDVSNAWNFNFDDDESDGADVAAFEYADPQKTEEGFHRDKYGLEEISRTHDGFTNKSSRVYGKGFSDTGPMKPGTGFNDFDDDEEDDDVDSYELDTRNEVHKTSGMDFSALEADSELEDMANPNDEWRLPHGQRVSLRRDQKPLRRKGSASGSDDDEIDFDTDDDLPIHSRWKPAQASSINQRKRDYMGLGSDDDTTLTSSSSDEEELQFRKNRRKQGSDRMRYGRRDRSSVSDEPLSVSESEDDLSYYRNRRGNERASSNDVSRGRNHMRRGRKTSFVDNSDRASRRSHSNRGTSYSDYDGQGMSGRGNELLNSGSRRDRSFNKRGGRSNNFDKQASDYLDDERFQRPRINVR